MRLKKITVTPNHVYYEGDIKRDNGSSRKIEETAKEAPLKEFTEALCALKQVVQTMHALPPGWLENVKILGVTISYTAKGTRSVFIDWEKPLVGLVDMFRPKKLLVPIDRPMDGDEGAYQPPLPDKFNQMVATFLTYADKYVNGDRQQLQLGLADQD